MEELYHQITLDEWINMKEELAKDFQGVAQSFVRIGYKLRKIREQELYRNDGCESITEWGQKEYGLSAAVISRFIKINERYSIGGNSDELLPEYATYGSSKLSEMLALPDEDLEMVRPEMSREGIRELKDFNKSEPKEENDLTDLVRGFWAQLSKRALLKELDFDADLEDLIDQINPSGNQTFRKGMYIMMMYEDEIKVKKVGGAPETMTWERFCEITKEISEESKQEEEKTEQTEEKAKQTEEKAEQTEEKEQLTEEKAELTDQGAGQDEQEADHEEETEEKAKEKAEEETKEETKEETEEETEEEAEEDETEAETENEDAAAVEAEVIEEKKTEESLENTDQTVSLGTLTAMIGELRQACWSKMWDDAIEMTEKIRKTIEEVRECL